MQEPRTPRRPSSRSDRPAESRVPRWDARGSGPLPWQGIACLDHRERPLPRRGHHRPGRRPESVPPRRRRPIVGQHRAGHRWINEVTVSNDGRFVSGLCTTPEGTSGDAPRLYGFSRGAGTDAGLRPLPVRRLPPGRVPVPLRRPFEPSAARLPLGWRPLGGCRR